MNQKVAVIGAERMGSTLAAALHKRGFDTTVWNRTSSKTESLSRLGLRVAPSLLEAVGNAEIVVVNINNYESANQLVRQPAIESALRGKVLVQLSSGTPDEARKMESWARPRGIGYLDGAIMSYPSGIGTPECTIFYSGAEESFARVKPLLLALGGNPMFVGTAIGHASALDLAGLTFVLGAMFGFVQGCVVSDDEGLPAGAFVQSIQALLPAVGGILEAMAARIPKKNYSGDEATLEAWSIGPKELIEWAKERHMDVSLANAQMKLFERAVQAGQGQADFSYLYEVFKKN
jgi:3-hydroxyisobutyrate dehydrogenase-like beta-hydroxyacid dehydrogenase